MDNITEVSSNNWLIYSMMVHSPLGEFVDKYRQTDRDVKNKSKNKIYPPTDSEKQKRDSDASSYHLRFEDVKEFKHKEGGGK